MHAVCALLQVGLAPFLDLERIGAGRSRDLTAALSSFMVGRKEAALVFRGSGSPEAQR